MIDKATLRKIARERLKDAQALFNAGRYDGAIYLGGYVVELGIKWRICKTLNWLEFPQTRVEFQGKQSFKTHNLDRLLVFSGVENKVKAKYLAEWSIVATWDPEARYNPIASASKEDASSLLEAARKLLSVL
ncbi:MAG: hypothetical protein ABIP78_06665 [Pyrinomonadaceae bacterium]